MPGNYSLNYNVDIVFCIDITKSMDMDRVLDTIKVNAYNFYDDVVKKMNSKDKPIRDLRIRLVAFRDYIADGDQAMLVTDFFNMPEQASDFKECLDSIKADGGGDDPEDGLEALAYAMHSDWNKGPGKKRQIIVVWSDECTHPIGYGSKSPYYPKGMPKDFNELTEWWGNKSMNGAMDESSKRLLMFTPNKPYWSNIRENWNNTIHYESEAGKGLDIADYDQIINAICGSI